MFPSCICHFQGQKHVGLVWIVLPLNVLLSSSAEQYITDAFRRHGIVKLLPNITTESMHSKKNQKDLHQQTRPHSASIALGI